MRTISGFLLTLVLASAVLAQGRKFEINAETPEGQLLQKAGQAGTDAERVALYEEFIGKYPEHPGIVYAWNQAQPLLLKAGAHDKVIAGAAVILAAEPGNSPAAYNALQAAEQKNDVPAIITWANRTVAAARATIESKKPEDEDEAAHWTANVDFAKQVIARCEYSFYASALKSTDPASISALYEGLEKANAQSQYIPMAGPRYFIALLQAKNLPKAQAFAEAAAGRNQANEDMLLFAADANLTAKENDKAAAFAAQLAARLPEQPAPQGVAPADWEAKKKTTLARAHWIAGMAYGARSDWPNTEKSMRASLPFIAGNAALKDLLPAAYFYLGLSNYNLSRGAKPDAARRAEARKYFTLCNEIPSPYQNQAARNLNSMTLGK